MVRCKGCRIGLKGEGVGLRLHHLHCRNTITCRGTLTPQDAFLKNLTLRLGRFRADSSPGGYLAISELVVIVGDILSVLTNFD